MHQWACAALGCSPVGMLVSCVGGYACAARQWWVCYCLAIMGVLMLHVGLLVSDLHESKIEEQIKKIRRTLLHCLNPACMQHVLLEECNVCNLAQRES
eukprot:1161656-Pelagomonas_calceolata.AAC.6